MRIEDINELNDLLREMEKRLGLFIGNSEFGRLCSFIDGYLYAKDANQSKLSLKEKKFQNKFYIYIKNYYNDSPNISVGWEYIILFYTSNNNEEAIKRFFEHYKQWYKEEFGEDAW